jgi:hypothetical protein
MAATPPHTPCGPGRPPSAHLRGRGYSARRWPGRGPWVQAGGILRILWRAWWTPGGCGQQAEPQGLRSAVARSPSRAISHSQASREACENLNRRIKIHLIRSCGTWRRVRRRCVESVHRSGMEFPRATVSGIHSANPVLRDLGHDGGSTFPHYTSAPLQLQWRRRPTCCRLRCQEG